MDLAGVNYSTQPELPLSYAVVPPAELDGGDIVLLLSEHPVRPRNDRITGATVKDQAWIDQVSDIILNSTDPGQHIVTWAGFNANLLNEDTIKPKAIIGVLPLFPDKAASVPMVKHAMNIGKSVTEFLNPSQTPVIGMDQPTLLGSRFSGDGMKVWARESTC